MLISPHVGLVVAPQIVSTGESEIKFILHRCKRLVSGQLWAT